jgi:tetratricopeptide (TPR) repeat protein
VVAAPDASEAWRARFCAAEATFVYEKRDEGHVERAREAWEACLDEFPTDARLVTAGVSFFDSVGESDRSLELLRRAAEEAPEKIDFRMTLGRRLGAMGEDDEAEQTLREAAQASRGPAVWLALAEYHLEREEFAKARAAMERALDQMPQVPPATRMAYADLLIRAGAFDTAEEEIALIVTPEIKNLLLGRLALAQGQPRRALALLDDGIRLWPGNSVARQLAAEAAEQLGNYDRALAEYTEAVRSDNSNWEALHQLAGLHEAMRAPDLIVQLTNRYNRSNPRDPKGYRLLARVGIWSERDRVTQSAIRDLGRLPGQEEAAAMLAAMLRASKDPADAVEFISQAPLDLTRQESAGVLRVLVENLSKLGRHAEAIARSDAAIDVHPDFAPFHELRADALSSAGRPQEEVRQALERALELEPDRSSTLIELGTLAAERGEIDDSIAFFDRAGAANSTSPEAAWAAIETLLAHGRDAEVDTRLAKLLAIRGSHAGAAHLMARRIAERGGDLERAARLSRRAVRFGGGAKALATLGRIRLEQGNTDAAIGALRGSLEARPDSASTHYWLGVALARSGDADGARTELNAALASGEFAEEEQARVELSRLAP